MLTWIVNTWCKRVHRRAMWPIHGKYICSKCLREYPVSWETRRLGVLNTHTPASYPVPPLALPLSGSPDSSTYLTRSTKSAARKGFAKKCKSVAGMP